MAVHQNLATHREDKSSEHSNEYDEEINETEEDLIENFRFLTEHCGVLRPSPTTSILSKIPPASTVYLRPYSSVTEHNQPLRSESAPRNRASPFDDLNKTRSIPPTIYYDDPPGEELNSKKYRSFSLVKLFARMKARLNHDRRYRAEATHQILTEEEPNDWYELTKNVQTVLTKALLPDGGYDALVSRYPHRSSTKKSRDKTPVLRKDVDDDEEKTTVTDIDPSLQNLTEDERDQTIWKNFLCCSRGFHYRRVAVCKAIDRQYFQGQLVYFYGVANNILIDENLKASGLG